MTSPAAAKMRRARDLLRSVAAEFCADSYTGQDITFFLQVTKEIKNLNTSIELRSIRRVEQSRIYEQKGHKTAGSFIAELTSQPVGKAKEALETARAVVANPDISKAMNSGRLSETQAKQIASAAELDPTQAPALIDIASSGSHAELKEAVTNVRNRSLSGEDGVVRHEVMRRQRYCRTWIDAEGFGRLDAKVMPDSLDAIRSAMHPFVESVYKEARSAGVRESHQAYCADALVEMARSKARGTDKKAPKALVRIRVDFDALLRGYTVGDEISELIGGGAISPLHVLALTKDATLELIATRGKEIYKVVTETRYIARVVDIALEERDRTCSHAGCDITFPLERDHVYEMQDGGLTRLENLVRVCPYHHYLKTCKGWTWEGEPGGKMQLVSREERLSREGRQKEPPDTQPLVETPSNRHRRAPDIQGSFIGVDP